MNYLKQKGWVVKMCNYCLHDTCPSGCPNYKQKNSKYICSVCGENICEGEEYIKNDEGEFRHFDCFYGIKDLLEWLGYEIKTMEHNE